MVVLAEGWMEACEDSEVGLAAVTGGTRDWHRIDEYLERERDCTCSSLM
jgi:hypothetical protein